MRMIFLLFTFLLPGLAFAGPLETKINQFEELQRLLQRHCINNPNASAVKVVVNGSELSCSHLLTLATRLETDIEDDVEEIEEDCEQPAPAPAAAQLARQSAAAAAQSVCRPQSTDAQCMASFTCSIASKIGSSIPIFGRPIAGMLRSCRGNYSAGGCIQNIAKGIFDAVWGLVSAVWDVGKAAVRGVGEWLGVVRAGENSTSEKLMAAQRAGRDFVSRFMSAPIQTMRQTASAIFNGLKTAAMSSYGCEQWADPRRPFVSRCVRPMTNWNCASCQQKFQVFCGIAGMAIGEIPAALLTGGVLGGARAIGRAAAAAVRANARVGRVNRGVAELLTRFRPPAGLGRATENIAQLAGRTMTAVERRVIARWNRLKDNPLSRLIARSARNADASDVAEARRFRLRPVGFYVDAIEAAARLGFRTGDEAVSAVVGTGGREASSAVVAARIGGMTDLERDLPAEARVIDQVTPDDLSDMAGDTVNVSDDVADIAPQSPSSQGITVSDASRVARVEAPVVTSPSPVPSSSNSIVVNTPAVPARAPAAAAQAGNPEDIIQSVSGSGNRYDLEDREITIDILTGGAKRDEYFENRSPEFQRRYNEIQENFNGLDPVTRQRYQDDFRRGADEVVAGGNERAARELDELSRETRLTSQDIDCNAMNALYPGSFPGRGGQCKRVRFDEDSKGKFCACGAMSKDTFNFLTRCPRSSAEFHSVFGFANGVALPSTSLPQACTRVDIPRGKECYFGSTSATYAGMGGLTQMLCLDEASPRMRGGANGAIERFGIQIGTPRIQPVRWSPFSDFEDLQTIIERASRVCQDVCDVSVFRNINRDYAAAIDRIQNRTTDPVKLARLRSEQDSFQLYMQGLRGGRLPTPTLSRAADLSNPARLTEARRILRTDLTPAQQAAVIRAHEVGRGRGYFTYTQAQISEKARILREAGLDRDQIRRLMRNGIVGGRADDAIQTFADARMSGVTARQLRERLRDNDPVTVEKIKTEFRSAADGYASEAARTNDASLTAEAWRLYARGGDPQAALGMLERGTRLGMDPQRVLSGLQQEFVAVSERIARSPNAALIVERNAYQEIINGARGRLGLEPRRIDPTVNPFAAREAAERRQLGQIDRDRLERENPLPSRTPAAVVPERDLAGKITDDLHEAWRQNFIATNGADAVRNKPVPDSVLRAGETPEAALARLRSEGVTGLSIEDGKLVQNINQPAGSIIPELNQTLNGNLATEYATLVQRGNFRSAADMERASSEIHEIWMRNNEWQRGSNPELFKPYNQLTAEEKIKDLDVLAQSLRARDPQLLNSPAYREYRQRLEREVAREVELRRPAGSYSPQEAQRIANELRLGTPARPKDARRAAEFYYRASNDLVRREAQRTRGYANGGSNFMGDRNFSEAFEQSLQSDGELAIRMLEDIRVSGGETRQMSAVNSFLAENSQRFNTGHPNPAVRANIRRLLRHVEDNYGSNLYDPQRNYMRSWTSANSDEIVIPPSTRAKISNHVGLTNEQNSFIDTLIQRRGERALTDEQVITLMGPNVEARPFRGNNVTSMFPDGVSPDDVVREFRRGNFRPAARREGTSSNLSSYEVRIGENRYNLYVCTAPTCEVDGVTLTANQVRTVFPNCGPQVRGLMKLARAKDVLRQPGPITRDSFFEQLNCRD